ncbi:MAG TPA: hypothetical protein ENN41_08110 [Sediminispirochaeta sp.]|nr:hypothetical protein [Sediminispirochaeta sp.]
MLKNILAKIVESRAVNYRDIAAQTHIPEPMVRQMVWELERLGYLRPVMQGCSQSACSGCGMKCGIKTPLQKAFVLTSKGRGFLHAGGVVEEDERD